MHRPFQIKKHNYNLIATRCSTELKSKAGMEIEIFSFSHWKLQTCHFHGVPEVHGAVCWLFGAKQTQIFIAKLLVRIFPGMCQGHYLRNIFDTCALRYNHSLHDALNFQEAGPCPLIAFKVPIQF